MEQMSLFDKFDGNEELLQKYKYSLLLSAIGDSIGWPLEFLKRQPQEPFETFIKWKKLVGGKWWGYEDEILPGEYSDDTQLALAVSRSIDSLGNFNPDNFAFLELPLWLNYERGGGRSLKTAARNILKKKIQWYSNFYNTKDINYMNAGANGAAMRNLPIALVNVNNEKRFIVDTFKNSIITHGHARAIVGSIQIGLTQIFSLKEKEINHQRLCDYITDNLERSLSIAREDAKVNEWFQLVEKHDANYEKRYQEIVAEAKDFIMKISDYLSKDEKEYYSFTKALEPSFKSSGVSTTAVAIFMFLKYVENPEKALFQSANFVGSDTDTIAAFVGSLLGCFYGNALSSRKISTLIEQLQDKEYLERTAGYLWNINYGDLNIKEARKIGKTEALLRILAWEIGLHELFWESLDEGDKVVHPALGRGTIQRKVIKKIRNRDDYVAKIFKIKFDTGQTAYFHSRVSKEGFVTESLSKEVDQAL